MKKTVSLIMAILLSITVFASDIAGIAMIVRADEYTEGSEEDIQPVQDDEDDPQPEPEQPQPEPEQPQPEPEQPQPDQPQPPQPGPSQDDDRESAYDKAAEEAQKEAERLAAEAAAQEAQRLAEEQAALAAKAAEEAKKAQEQKKAQEESQDYTLVASVGSTTVSKVNFGSAMVGAQRDVVPLIVTNTGNSKVNLIYCKTNDADNAFSISNHGGNTELEPRQSACFNVSMSSSLGVGKYTAYVKFADAQKDPNYSKALTVTLDGTVTRNTPVVTDINVIPSRITLAVGGSAQFSAEVSGNTDTLYNIRWSVAGNRSTGTTISDSGVLRVADDETSMTLTVIASTDIDPSVTGAASVSLQRNSYNVNAYASPSQGGRVTGGGAVAEGGSVTLSAVPNRNYVFKGWTIKKKTVSTDTNYTISNITSNMDVVAVFEQNRVTVTVNTNNSNAGDAVGGGSVEYGGSTTLSARAYSGYVFIGWKEADTMISRDASLKLKNLTADRKITAIFEQTSHTLTVVAYPSEGGSVTGGGTFDLDKGTTIKASAAPGYKFDGWQVNGQYISRDQEYRIDRVKHDITCTAIFIKTSGITYEISSGVATTGGSIAPSGKMNVLCGQNMTYTITPKSGFAILAVAVDGVQVGPVASYTFANVQGPHMIVAAFVMTDAGKAAAEASGKQAQTRKVEKIEKTSQNTASGDSTVDLDEAASGEGGDNFVEEMDLSGVEIPTDEQLGIIESVDDVQESEVVRMLGKSTSEVSDMVSSGDTVPVLDAAFLSGYLGAYVVNSFEPSKMNGVDYNKLSREELMMLTNDEINPSLPDLDVVVQRMLSTDDVMKLVRGEHVDIAVSLTSQEPDRATGRIMKNAVGKKPVKYFDLTMLKTVDGLTQRVTELPTTMEVVIEVPDEVYRNGKSYSVLRVHDGELSVLPDLDDDPKTITFRTDKFSSYAIAQDVATANTLVAWLAAGAALAFGVAVTCLLILLAHQRKMRRSKKA